MLKNVKLYHLQLNSRAMVARAMMWHKKQPFEDIRIPYEEWKDLKYSGKFEFRVLPLLEVDGKQYTQMYAINNYLARKLDLFGNDIEEDYLINSLLNSYEDFSGKARKGQLLSTEEERKKAVQDFIKIHAPFYLTAYENRFKKYGGEYMVGNKFTIADVYVTCYLFNNFKNQSKVKRYGPNFLETYAPLLGKHIEKIRANQLKEYFENAYIEEESPEEMVKISELIRNS